MPYVVIRRRCGNKSGVRHKAISLDRNGGGSEARRRNNGGTLGEEGTDKVEKLEFNRREKKSRENIETVIFD